MKKVVREEKTSKMQDHFKNVLENPRKITDKPTQKINNGEVNVKLGQFPEEETSRSIENKKKEYTEKLPASTEYQVKSGKQENLTINFFPRQRWL